MSYIAYNLNSLNLSDEEISSIGASCAAELSERFDNHNIPNLLWGRLALGLVGEWTKDTEVEFIIPDKLIEKAADLITAHTGWERCTNTECPHMMYHRRQIPNIHIHMSNEESQPIPWWTIICLHKKSELVWWMDDLKVRHIDPEDRVLQISVDKNLPKANLARRGSCGPWKDNYPVAILKSEALAKALLLLMCRDFQHPNHWYIEWKRMLEGLMDGGRDWVVESRLLKPKYRRCWLKIVRNYLTEDTTPWEPILELQAILRKKKRLPSAFYVEGFESPEEPEKDAMQVRKYC